MSIFSSNRDSQPTPTAPERPTPSTHTPTPNSLSTRAGNTTNISQGTQVDGNIKIEGNIQIDGHVKGTLTSKGKVVIGSGGIIDGDVLCQHAEISGKVNGKLKIADILFLKASARIEGDIQTGKLVMESGVQFNGNCSMGSAATVPQSGDRKATASPTVSASASSSANVSSNSSSNGQEK